MVSMSCNKKNRQFCYVCANYINVKSRKKFTSGMQERYKKIFKVNELENYGEDFAVSIICGACNLMLSQVSSKKIPLTKTCAKWMRPKKDHSNCFLCNTHLTLNQMKNPKQYTYDQNLSCERPRKLQNSMEFDDGSDDQ